jgi:coenzyme PQQ precursor peptide PqqA
LLSLRELQIIDLVLKYPASGRSKYPLVGHLGGKAMKWLKPKVQEYCVGMEVTSYESADIDPDTLI